MLGHVARFDFQQVGRDLPKVDLPDLERFFTATIALNGRRVFKRDEGLDVKTPEAWMRDDYALAERYEGLAFDRTLSGPGAATRVIGVGHRLFDRSLREAERSTANLAVCARLEWPLLLVAIEDEVTGTQAQVGRIVVGLYRDAQGHHIVRDWELLLMLNGLGAVDDGTPVPLSAQLEDTSALLADAEADLMAQAPFMTRARPWLEILLLPASHAATA
jgi:hypothetical protein